MWDPLLNEFPETVHGFRCMLAVKYLQLVEKTYSPDTLGYDLIRDLISVIRARNYVEATSRYNHFHTRFEGTSPSQLRQPICEPCCCPHCPRHQSKSMGEQAHEQKAQDVQDVQKSRCP
uniref:Protein V2 n=1 Tax=Tomato leaf curl Karnataka virus TaxID=220932 RepID=A0A173H397_9GEMI|nr:AV2 [Tomato leaf curl Karnataka virus]WNV48301.1 precoat protein [Tomato leaf curl Karnataka virus]WNV48307.1 precoat protein [Tomato leaf curl Karnataka virus]WNV48313.1 precoat protein [Tomato leaf curl Karnataka virus]WNV48319.1 precoat protein [Tomato leaf curl Karnataka virus]